jgi:hypothetical protein
MTWNFIVPYTWSGMELQSAMRNFVTASFESFNDRATVVPSKSCNAVQSGNMTPPSPRFKYRGAETKAMYPASYP